MKRVASGYISDGKYEVEYTESETRVSFDLRFVALEKPYVKKYEHFDAETMRQFNEALAGGNSFGAYEDGLLVGLLIAEARRWNNSLWVHEFHVAETHRRRGIGKCLIERATEKAKSEGLRIIVCETQNTNTDAIKTYRRLGFKMEGVDISLYRNTDYPDGEIAVFMKLRL